MKILLLKAHVRGYLKHSGTFVAAHEDRRPARQIELFAREPTGGDQVVVFPYASGMSRRRDMAAGIESAAGLGTQIHEISNPGLDAIADAVAEGKPVFVDSGAFPAFKAAMRAGKPEDARLDFDAVFAKYDELIRRVHERAPGSLERSLLMLVAPDVVGDQAATLALLERHRDQIASWLEAGHEVIVPFQKGALKQSEVFKRVGEILGGYDFVVGIPSAAEALSNADLRELLEQPYKPERLHILGAISSKRMEDRMAVIRDAYLDDIPGVTADANVMRSKLHELGGLKGTEKFEKIKELLNRITPEMWGGTMVVKSFVVPVRRPVVLLLKAHVKGYTRKDGVYVRAHEDRRRVGRVIAASVIADRALPFEAQMAMEDFVGGPPDAHHNGYEGGVWSERNLEDALSDSPSERGAIIRAQLEAAFAPVREALRRQFGDKIKLYRSQREVAPDASRRNVLSWTIHRKVANGFAGIRRYKPIADEEVEAAVEKYERTGFLKFRGTYYLRSKLNPIYYNIFDRNRQHVTDGDDLRGDLRSQQREPSQRWPVVAAEVPIDDIVWVTNRFNQREFIVRNRGVHAQHPPVQP